MEIHPKSTRYHYVWVARQIKNLLQRSATTDRKEASNSQKDGGSARDPQIPEPRTTRPPPRTRLRAGDPPKWRANAGCAKTYIPSSPRIRCILRRCTSLVAFLLMDTPSAAGYAVCRRIRRLPQGTPSAAGHAVCRRIRRLPQDTPSTKSSHTSSPCTLLRDTPSQGPSAQHAPLPTFCQVSFPNTYHPLALLDSSFYFYFHFYFYLDLFIFSLFICIYIFILFFIFQDCILFLFLFLFVFLVFFYCYLSLLFKLLFILLYFILSLYSIFIFILFLLVCVFWFYAYLYSYLRFILILILFYF